LFAGIPLAERDALAATHNPEAVLGTFSFGEQRDGHYSAVIKIVLGGTFIVLR
jgi:hypothetical protein